MAIRTSPAFDSELVGETPDRIYQLPDSIPPMMAGVVTTGVVDGMAVTVTSPNTMATRVSVGRAYVEGAYVEVFGAAETVAHDPGEAQSRVDLVTLRLDRVNRTLAPHVLKGTSGSSTPPAPVSSPTTRDLPLREVTIPASATFISTGNLGTDRRSYTRTVTPGAPTDGSHAANKAYADNLGTIHATPSTIARRTNEGRLIGAAPNSSHHLTTKGYVDNSRNFIRIQTFASSTDVTHGLSTAQTVAAGTIERPSGWSVYDVLLDGYAEVRMRYTSLWRFTLVPEVQVGGTWFNGALTNTLQTVVHISNTSATYVYQVVPTTGRLTGLSGNQPLRWRYTFSSAASGTASREWQSTRRVVRATLLRRS